VYKNNAYLAEIQGPSDAGRPGGRKSDAESDGKPGHPAPPAARLSACSSTASTAEAGSPTGTNRRRSAAWTPIPIARLTPPEKAKRRRKTMEEEEEEEEEGGRR